MVTEVAYFCTAGHTEMGDSLDPRVPSLHHFLLKVNPELRWMRCFPTRLKPGPKLRREGVIRPGESGVTGKKLISLMYDRLKQYGCSSNIIVIIDDGDCRFSSREELNKWVARCQDEVRSILKRDVTVLALIASPEVEAWFLADWERGFGHEYRLLGQAFLHECRGLRGSGDTSIEFFGMPFRDNSCTTKLSEEIVGALRRVQTKWKNLETPQETFRYSKARQGANMLSRVRPEVIARECTVFFGPVFHELSALKGNRRY